MKFLPWLIIILSFITGCNRIYEQTADALAKVAESKQAISLGEITSHKWDSVYVIGPYQLFDHSHIKGIPRKVKKRLMSQELYDTWFVLLFVDNQNFVFYSDVHRGTIDDLGLKEGTYSHETIIPLI